MSFTSRRKRYLSFFLSLLPALVASDSVLAQPGDIARSLAADFGVVGELGEPNRGHGFAESVKCRVRPQDEVWVISSRHLDWPECNGVPPALKYWRWDCGTNRWRKLPAAAFTESDSAPVITMFYVHGNRIDSWQAIDLGWYAYDSIVRSQGDDRPVRFVIYSWPSTRIVGSQLNDLRYKAARTNAEAYYLGWVLAQVREDVRVSTMGFSYGARVITGALHVAAGGEICSLALPPDAPRRQHNVRCVLMAAALHNTWLGEGCFHGRAMAATDRMLILANSCDNILCRYHWVFKGCRPKALGYTGLPWRDDRIEQWDCCCPLGKTHDSLLYLDACTTADLWRPCMFWE